jgi:hypothetical protein
MNIGILGTGMVLQAIGAKLIEIGQQSRMGLLKDSDALPKSYVARMIPEFPPEGKDTTKNFVDTGQFANCCCNFVSSGIWMVSPT